MWREPGADFAERAFQVRNAGEDDASYEARMVASVARHLNVSPFLDMAGTVDSSPEESPEAFRKRVWDAAAKKLRVKRAGEGDEAFARRQLRARMKATAKVGASDQLAPLTARAVAPLQKHGLGMDAAQIRRENPRPISGRSLYGRNVLTDVNAQFLYSQRFAEQLRRRQEPPGRA